MSSTMVDAFMGIFGLTKASKFSCVMAYLDNADYIHNITKELIKKEDTYNDGTHEYGYEDEPHVTCLYGLHTNNPLDIMKMVSDIKPFSIKLGKISKFESDQYDVIKLDVQGKELERINSLLKSLPYTNSYNEYIPHLTLAYTKKGSCDYLMNSDVFYDHEFIINRLVFSDCNSKKTSFIL